MISHIKVKNYKLFKEFSISSIPSILLVGGENNSGKTTLLESVSVVLDTENPAMLVKHLLFRGLPTFYGDINTVCGLSYHNFDMEEPIVFEYTLNSSKKKLSYKFVSSNQLPINKEADSFNLRKELSQGVIEISCDGKKEALLTWSKDGLRLEDINPSQERLARYNGNMEAIFASLNPMLSQGFINRYNEMEKRNKTDSLVKALQILEPRLKSLSLLMMEQDVFDVYGDIGLSTKVPLALMGQGMNHLMSILANISFAKGGIVLIDELENGFHHSILPRMWEIITNYAKDHNTQIIATTQSRDLISSAVEGIPSALRDDFKYLRLEKGKDCVKYKSYNFDLLKGALESDLEIR